VWVFIIASQESSCKKDDCRRLKTDIHAGSSEVQAWCIRPKPTSWLNQVERWCSILVRRLLKRASFPSVEALRERVLAFIAYCNATVAKPFKWTYKGRPLAV